MPLLQIDPARVAREAQNAELAREGDRRATWRTVAYLAVAGACWAGGMFVVGTSFAVVGDERGNLLLWAGLCLGNIGPFLVWITWLVDGTNRGEL